MIQSCCHVSRKASTLQRNSSLSPAATLARWSLTLMKRSTTRRRRLPHHYLRVPRHYSAYSKPTWHTNWKSTRNVLVLIGWQSHTMISTPTGSPVRHRIVSCYSTMHPPCWFNRLWQHPMLLTTNRGRLYPWIQLTSSIESGPKVLNVIPIPMQSLRKTTNGKVGTENSPWRHVPNKWIISSMKNNTNRL
jgi:hypothetical protein